MLRYEVRETPNAQARSPTARQLALTWSIGDIEGHVGHRNSEGQLLRRLVPPPVHPLQHQPCCKGKCEAYSGTSCKQHCVIM